MQKFIISVKEKTTGRDVIPPYIVNSLDGLGDYSERVSPLGLSVDVQNYIKRLRMITSIFLYLIVKSYIVNMRML
jgi:hypothetical protein